MIDELSEVETIAVNLSIRDKADLKARYGGRRWRKGKAFGKVRLSNGRIRDAEIH